MTANIPILEKHGKKILNESLAPQIKSYFEPMWQSRNALNKTNNEASATITDAKNVLHSMLFKVSGAMFAIATNYLVSTSIVCHPKKFSQLLMAENNSEAASFRKLGDVQSMKKYVLHPFTAHSSETLSRKASKAVTKAFGESPSNSKSDSDRGKKLHLQLATQFYS